MIQIKLSFNATRICLVKVTTFEHLEIDSHVERVCFAPSIVLHIS